YACAGHAARAHGRLPAPARSARCRGGGIGGRARDAQARCLVSQGLAARRRHQGERPSRHHGGRDRNPSSRLSRSPRRRRERDPPGGGSVERTGRRVSRRGAKRPEEPLEKLLARLLESGDELPFATVDHDRVRRTGAPEVVYAAGKTPPQVVEIARRIVARAGRCLITRAPLETRAALRAAFADARVNDRARTVFLRRAPSPIGRGCVVSAGTSDLPVAEEAVETLLALGSGVERLVDVGVAGLHRILLRSPSVRRAHAVIVVAGMEGALPSVVGGLTARPVF